MGKGSARQGVKKTKRLTGNKKPVRQTKVRRKREERRDTNGGVGREGLTVGGNRLQENNT